MEFDAQAIAKEILSDTLLKGHINAFYDGKTKLIIDDIAKKTKIDKSQLAKDIIDASIRNGVHIYTTDAITDAVETAMGTGAEYLKNGVFTEVIMDYTAEVWNNLAEMSPEYAMAIVSTGIMQDTIGVSANMALTGALLIPENVREEMKSAATDLINDISSEELKKTFKRFTKEALESALEYTTLHENGARSLNTDKICDAFVNHVNDIKGNAMNLQEFSSKLSDKSIHFLEKDVQATSSFLVKKWFLKLEAMAAANFLDKLCGFTPEDFQAHAYMLRGLQRKYDNELKRLTGLNPDSPSINKETTSTSADIKVYSSKKILNGLAYNASRGISRSQLGYKIISNLIDQFDKKTVSSALIVVKTPADFDSLSKERQAHLKEIDIILKDGKQNCLAIANVAVELIQLSKDLFKSPLKNLKAMNTLLEDSSKTLRTRIKEEQIRVEVGKGLTKMGITPRREYSENLKDKNYYAYMGEYRIAVTSHGLEFYSVKTNEPIRPNACDPRIEILLDNERNIAAKYKDESIGAQNKDIKFEEQRFVLGLDERTKKFGDELEKIANNSFNFTRTGEIAAHLGKYLIKANKNGYTFLDWETLKEVKPDTSDKKIKQLLDESDKKMDLQLNKGDKKMEQSLDEGNKKMRLWLDETKDMNTPTFGNYTPEALAFREKNTDGSS